jgi:hypothetical protein
LVLALFSRLVAPAASESHDATVSTTSAQQSTLTTRARRDARTCRVGDEVTRSSGTPPRIAGSRSLMPAHGQSPPGWRRATGGIPPRSRAPRPVVHRVAGQGRYLGSVIVRTRCATAHTMDT